MYLVLLLIITMVWTYVSFMRARRKGDESRTRMAAFSLVLLAIGAVWLVVGVISGYVKLR